MRELPYKVSFKRHISWGPHVEKIQWCQNRGISKWDYDISDIASSKGETWHFANEGDAVAFRLRFGL